MARFSVLDISKYLVKSGVLLNHKKLQKMVYYAYSWYLVKNNTSSENLKEKLFDNRIEAWVHGPVCPDLYYAYNNNKILTYKEKDIDSATQELLNNVISIYGKYTGEELERMTHTEDPWRMARKGYSKYERSNIEINDKDIYDFYSSKVV